MIRDGCYQTALQYLRPLQSHRDAVEKDEGQDNVVKELMGDDGLAEEPESDREGYKDEDMRRIQVLL